VRKVCLSSAIAHRISLPLYRRSLSFLHHPCAIRTLPNFTTKRLPKQQHCPLVTPPQLAGQGNSSHKEGTRVTQRRRKPGWDTTHLCAGLAVHLQGPSISRGVPWRPLVVTEASPPLSSTQLGATPEAAGSCPRIRGTAVRGIRRQS